MFGPPRDLRKRQYWTVGAIVRPQQVPGIVRYILHCDTQKAVNLFALVSSHYGTLVLLA